MSIKKSLPRRGKSPRGPVGETSTLPVAVEKPFDQVFRELSGRKAEIVQRQRTLFERRYDLSDRTDTGKLLVDLSAVRDAERFDWSSPRTTTRSAPKRWRSATSSSCASRFVGDS